MKILHVAQMRSSPVGIARQMLEEQDSADQLNILWDSRLFVPKNCGVNRVCVESNYSSLEKSEFRKSFFSWLIDFSSGYDVILLRHSFYCPEEIFFIRRIKKPVILVHHTLEIPELKSIGGIKGIFLAELERFIGAHSLKLCSGIVAVTQEIAHHEQSRVKRELNKFIYPNGIIFDRQVFPDGRFGLVPEIAFICSSFVPWHGLDLLMDSICRAGRDLPFVLHLVGDLSEAQIELIGDDPRIIVHGVCKKDYIEDLISKCWVGVGSFALHRKNMKQACTLKVREYLVSGLPVYSGHEDIFDENFAHYKFGGCDIMEIVEYAKKSRLYDKRDIAESARVYIDKNILLSSLYKEIVESF